MPLPAGTYSPITITYRDKTGEIGTFSAYGLLNTDETFTDNDALADTFVTAQSAIGLGRIVSRYYGVYTIINPTGNASSASSQRENKLLVRYHDVTTLEKMSASIPTISLPALVFLSEARDFVNLTTPAFMPALLTAWAAFVTNPRTGNLTVIDSCEFVGRNS